LGAPFVSATLNGAGGNKSDKWNPELGTVGVSEAFRGARFSGGIGIKIF
jgi:hypothetical protein